MTGMIRIAAVLLLAAGPALGQLVTVGAARPGGAAFTGRPGARTGPAAPLQGASLQRSGPARGANFAPRRGVPNAAAARRPTPAELGFGLPESAVPTASRSQDQETRTAGSAALPALEIGSAGDLASPSFNRAARRVARASAGLAKPISLAADSKTQWDNAHPLGFEIMGLLGAGAGAADDSARSGGAGSNFEDASASGRGGGLARGGSEAGASAAEADASAGGRGRGIHFLSAGAEDAAGEAEGAARRQAAGPAALLEQTALGFDDPIQRDAWLGRSRSLAFGSGGRAATGGSSAAPFLGPVARLTLAVDGTRLVLGEARRSETSFQPAAFMPSAAGSDQSELIEASAADFGASRSAQATLSRPISDALSRSAAPLRAAPFSFLWLLAALPFAVRAAFEN